VMSAIRELDRDLTVIIVAHRLTTVRDCDVIYELQGGVIAAKGTYMELLQNSQSFRSMANQYS
jgi:ABC-type multidrug transport system fused ATPase/permease subunit